MASLTSERSGIGAAESTLTPAQILTLAAFSTCVWFLAAMFIRFAGPMGVFHGYKLIALYALTIPATIPLNARSRKLVRAPKGQMVTVIAVTSTVATLLDGAAMSRFPALYGADPAIPRSRALARLGCSGPSASRAASAW